MSKNTSFLFGGQPTVFGLILPALKANGLNVTKAYTFADNLENIQYLKKEKFPLPGITAIEAGNIPISPIPEDDNDIPLGLFDGVQVLLTSSIDSNVVKRLGLKYPQMQICNLDIMAQRHYATMFA